MYICLNVLFCSCRHYLCCLLLLFVLFRACLLSVLFFCCDYVGRVLCVARLLLVSLISTCLNVFFCNFVHSCLFVLVFFIVCSNCFKYLVRLLSIVMFVCLNVFICVCVIMCCVFGLFVVCSFMVYARCFLVYAVLFCFFALRGWSIAFSFYFNVFECFYFVYVFIMFDFMLFDGFKRCCSTTFVFTCLFASTCLNDFLSSCVHSFVFICFVCCLFCLTFVSFYGLSFCHYH